MGAQASIRVLVATGVGTATAIALAVWGDLEYAFAVGWDVAAAIFCAWTWAVIGPMDAGATATHATREDPTRRVTNVIVLAASVASLAGVGFLLVHAGSDQSAARGVVEALGVGGVALSWMVVHTLFTLRYALLFYDDVDSVAGAPGSGIDFNNDKDRPRYTDFAYLAFTIGMTFQVSDTALSTHRIRSTALRHALLSYLFGSLILATSVNLIASLASSR